MRTSLYDYCVEYGLNALLQQWMPLKNAPLTPKTVSYGSKRRVWWSCEKGHQWQASIAARAGNNSDCPVCAGRIQPDRMERYRLALAEQHRN